MSTIDPPTRLDQPAAYAELDSARVGDAIAGVPDRCRRAFDAGRAWALPEPYRRARRVVVAGVAHGAAAGELVKCLFDTELPLPIEVWRDYGLPAFATGADTLVIAADPTGQADEVVSSLETASSRGCRALALTAGGALGQEAHRLGIPTAWIDEAGPFHLTGLWMSFFLLGALAELWLIPDPSAQVEEAFVVMSALPAAVGPNVPVTRNPAKRLAGQFSGRVPILAGAGSFTAVAAYWKLQLNHLSKLMAVCDPLPEANHSSLLGYGQPDTVWQKAIVIQLRGASESPRLAARLDATTTLMLQAGLNQDTLRARGRSSLAQLDSLATMGDWVSYYAAIIAGVDPAPAAVLETMADRD